MEQGGVERHHPKPTLACKTNVGIGAMPKYFFKVTGDLPIHDEIGEDLRDNEAAWEEATLIAGELFYKIDGKFRPGQTWSLEVQNETNQPIFLLRIVSEQMK